MKYTLASDRLEVKLMGDFNLNIVREIKRLLGERGELQVDLERARFVNSEAIIFMHHLINSKRTVRLKNPPKIFFEALKILQLHHAWDLKTIIER